MTITLYEDQLNVIQDDKLDSVYYIKEIQIIMYVNKHTKFTSCYSENDFFRQSSEKTFLVLFHT